MDMMIDEGIEMSLSLILRRITSLTLQEYPMALLVSSTLLIMKTLVGPNIEST